MRIVLEGSRGSAFWLSPECNWIELLQPLLLLQLKTGLATQRRFRRLARREAQFEMFKVGGELLPGCGYRVVRGDSKAEPFTAVLERALAPTTREGQNAPAQERTPV